MGKVIYHAKEDAAYQKPYVDVDEIRQRQIPNGPFVDYRYIHGGFEDTNVKFIVCLPEKDLFRGRFYQYLSPFPGPDEEVASLNREGQDDIIAFCLKNGAYYVESNMGSAAVFGGQADSTLCWKASAAVAEYSRIKAMEIYGCPRPFGYVFGGSGGGYKTMACIENTDAWDGAAPYVIGSPVSLPNTITIHAQGQRTLRNCFGKIIDALDAGGSGNPYEKLTPDEVAMLKEITAMGFNPLIWYCEANGKIDDGSLPVLTPGVKMMDPAFFEEFWTKPGYAGADPASTACKDRLQFRGRVISAHGPGQQVSDSSFDDRNGVDTAWKKALADGAGAWIHLEDVPKGEDLYLKGVNITVLTGKAAGKQLLLKDIVGNYLTIGMCFGMGDLGSVLSDIAPGDEISLDNSDYIAIQHYYRHQVPADLSFRAWDQFRDAEGRPTLPQRNFVMGYRFCGTGTVQDGHIQGKVINIQALTDESTCPWCGDWYRHKVIESTGSEENHRLYYMERCMHGDVSWMENNFVTNYMGALRQALLDLSDWVERGMEPPKTTAYEYRDGQIYVALEAKDRFGLQPVVQLTANGASCARVKAGEPVKLTASVQLPERGGKVTDIRFGFADNRNLPGGMDADFPMVGQITHTEEGAIAQAEYTYDKPGTYFASVLVQANRNGDEKDVFTQIKNLARARIIVV